MKILLVSATDFEISPVLKDFQKTTEKNGCFRNYIYENTCIDVLITGVGIPFTTFHLTTILGNTVYDLIINAGIAGSFHSNLPIGDVVQVASDQFADIGVEDKGDFKSIFDMNLNEKNQYPFQNGAIINRNDFKNVAINNLQKVSAITVNKVSGSAETIALLIKKYNPDIETMEGAAFSYVCKMRSVPFIQIRSISNYIEERNIEKWNIRLAVDNLNKALIEFIKTLT